MYTSQFREYNADIIKLDRYNQVVPCKNSLQIRLSSYIVKHTMVKLPVLTAEGGVAETYINANYITVTPYIIFPELMHERARE